MRGGDLFIAVESRRCSVLFCSVLFRSVMFFVLFRFQTEMMI